MWKETAPAVMPTSFDDFAPLHDRFVADRIQGVKPRDVNFYRIRETDGSFAPTGYLVVGEDVSEVNGDPSPGGVCIYVGETSDGFDPENEPGRYEPVPAAYWTDGLFRQAEKIARSVWFNAEGE